jgi:aspartyl-tRNA synthetase
VHLGKKLGLIKSGDYKLLWVTDFPLFEYDEEENRYIAKHHPFTMPKDESIDLLETNPGAAYAKAYDIILNGCELGGGSCRINDPEIQNKMFKAIGFTPDEAYERFGFLLDAFKFGAPPHAGMAFGLDRLVMLLLEKESIREVIAFPKVQNASELMTMCPSEVEEKQLKELGIEIEENI